VLAKDLGGAGLERDAHGNVQLSGSGALADLLCEEIKSKLKIKRVRGDTFGYLQRSFVGCVSDVDQREAREVGEKAVQYAMWGTTNGSVAIKRTGFYSVDYELLPLAAVAGKTRTMEDEFISDSGTDVTDAFRLYLRPLLGSGMPDAFRLRPNRGAQGAGPAQRLTTELPLDPGLGPGPPWGGRGARSCPPGQPSASFTCSLNSDRLTAVFTSRGSASRTENTPRILPFSPPPAGGGNRARS
jgi:hypothetical protein